MPFGPGALGEEQEGGIDAGVAQRQGASVDAHREVQKRLDQVLGDVGDP